MLTSLIIDDEPLAHQVVLHHLKQHKDVSVVHQCYSAVEALNWLASCASPKPSVDLLFLDINMPALNGMDMLKILANRPQVIVISASPDYALQGFELDVADYLLKPVDEKRLSKALDKVRAKLHVKEEPITHIVVKVERTQQRIELAQIHYLEAYGNYVKVWHSQGCTLANSTLKMLLSQLPETQFVQIHKSFVINKFFIHSLKSDSVCLTNAVELNIGKSYRGKLQL